MASLRQLETSFSALVCSLLLLLLLPSATIAMADANAQPQYFNLTAISAAGGKSTLECWQLTTPISVSSTAGTSGTKIQQLGNAANLSYTAIPPKFDGGKHNAPVAQYVAFLSGAARVTLPDGSDHADIKGGANGVIIAADTAAVSTEGHITTYPSKDITAVLQVPLANGQLPPHTVLHSGPCKPCELTLDDLKPPKKC